MIYLCPLSNIFIINYLTIFKVILLIFKLESIENNTNNNREPDINNKLK